MTKSLVRRSFRSISFSTKVDFGGVEMIHNVASVTKALAVASVFALTGSASAGVLSNSSAAPSGDIIASQLTDLGPGAMDGARNYTDNGGPPGQTFTVTSGGMANRFTVLGRGDSSDAWDGGRNAWEGDEIWGFQLGSVNTGTGAITVLATETATGFTAGGAIDITDYVTFTLTTPVNLSVGTTYVFSMYLSDAAGPGIDGGWFGFAHSDTDVYASGAAINNNFTIDNPGGNTGGPRRDFPLPGFAAPHPNNYDYVFAVQSVPSTLPPGDVNGDGLENLTDYGIIKTNFFLATGATRGMGDLSGDGRVNLTDFTIWRNRVPPPMATGLGVPEPSSSLFLMGSAALIAAGHRRRARRG